MLIQLIITSAVAAICILHFRESWSFPPGPPRYPIIGSLLSMKPKEKLSSKRSKLTYST